MKKLSLRKAYEKGREILKYHFSDSTAVLVLSNPIFAAAEVLGTFTDEASIRAKILGAAVVYAGIGSLSSRGRDLSRKIFKINEKSKEKIQAIHDSIYNGVFNVALFAPPFYYFTGTAKTFTQYAVGIGFAGLYGLTAGPVSGYFIDVGRDLTGLEECERKTYPKIIKNLTLRAKKAVATGAVAASVGICSLIYALTPDKINFQEIISPNKQEQRIENSIETQNTGSLEQILAQ